ncbi:hypothetical protein PRJ_5638 (plasmid) [Pseudomonas sp. XWY-1]|nr:hypothetical protein PRJ_5638 [Pseudomonas sp. XWY-1]
MRSASVHGQCDGGDKQGETWLEGGCIVVHGLIRPDLVR